MKPITLTTDFGLQDWFVGTMKGVIHRIAPRAPVFDLTHGVPAGDIRAGALALTAAYRFFPHGTIHVAVVDPGVGSERAAIAVKTKDYLFVGPDNGVLSWALAREQLKEIRRLEADRLFLKPVSQTFHGRDVFAPVAARLSCGLSFRKLGPATKDIVRLHWPEPAASGSRICGEVIYVDRFGNALTTITPALLARSPEGHWMIFLRGGEKLPLASCYSAVRPGCAAGIFGSSGWLEIAVNGGSAAQVFGLQIGQAVELRVEKPGATWPRRSGR